MSFALESTEVVFPLLTYPILKHITGVVSYKSFGEGSWDYLGMEQLVEYFKKEVSEENAVNCFSHP